MKTSKYNFIPIIIIWLCGFGLAFTISLVSKPASLVDGNYIPVGQDAFYHGYRILHAIESPNQYIQFDTKIHAPEGSWVTWPWGYDLGLAYLVKGIMSLTSITDPVTVLVYIPPFWTAINILILLAIGGALGLSIPMRALAVFIWSVLPLTQQLHGVGAIDHHYMEHTALLASLWLGIRWFNNPLNIYNGLIFGFILGLAPVIHNGLFILQIPLVLTILFLRFIKHIILPTTIAYISIGLLSATLFILLPSQPFWDTQFNYYTLSLFHLFTASLTAFIILILQIKKLTLVRMLMISSFLLSVVIYILPNIYHGAQFLTGDIQFLDNIAEAETVTEKLFKLNIQELANYYSALIFLLPLSLLWIVIKLFQEKNEKTLFFLISFLFWSLILLQQHRLHYFGSITLYLPLLIIIDNISKNRPKQKLIIGLITTLGISLALLPITHRIGTSPPLANDPWYALTYKIYPVMHTVCEENPGIILAEKEHGHHITYHTDCSVIANNFILTPQHLQKIQLTLDLLNSSPEELLKKAPYIQYVYVRREDNIFNTNEQEKRLKNNKLTYDLLFSKQQLPQTYQLISEIKLQTDTQEFLLARLFKIN